MNVIKVSFNAGSIKDRESIDQAPDKIEKHCKNFYLKESGELPVLNFEDLDVDNGNIDESHDKIEKKVFTLKDFSVLLGGDHSITRPAFKGFASGKRNPGIIVFDAHPDLMQPFDTQEDYLRALIEEGVLKAQNVILVGVRNSDKEEVKYIKQKGIKVYSMKKLASEGKNVICDDIMEIARSWSDLYLSIDIDALDPGSAPGVSYIEPGGMTTRELLYFVQRLKMLKHLGMADIVEVNPSKDINDMTVAAAAKILVELS